ncbi:coiled-coil domain-containing protein 97-like isoform X2 [Lineus longissimus]|uniref:coiled-coil domain-containing protein 97-like isoform X2 n=1 Tax=Lineus longissimus TaxID=88925 RepID=UPI00315C8D09
MDVDVSERLPKLLSGISTHGVESGNAQSQDHMPINDVEKAYWGEMPKSSEKGCSAEMDNNEKMDQTQDLAQGIGIIGLDSSPQQCTIPSAESPCGRDSFSCMIDRVAKSDAHFKHQQRDEPDLTYEEKSNIARKLFDDKPDQFLARFGKQLVEGDLQFFKHLESDYTIQFYMTEVKRLLDNKRTATNIKNRRYQAMLKMTSEGTYFSEEEMKERDPLLYEQMVGQFITEEEANEEVERQMDKSDLRFSTILMKHMQWSETNQLYKVQKDIEEGQEEESEEDDDEEDEQQVGDKAEWVPSEGERRLMRQEFLDLMKERFMSGNDKLYFDYSTVDENSEYDDLEIREHDDEDEYFNEEDSEDIEEEMECSALDETEFKMPERRGRPTCTSQLNISSQSRDAPS